MIISAEYDTISGSSGNYFNDTIFSSNPAQVQPFTGATNRISIESGGYFVRSGVCYIDFTFTAVQDMANKIIINSMPYYSSSFVYFAVPVDDTTYSMDNDSSMGRLRAVCSHYGTKYRLLATYSTTASDT